MNAKKKREKKRDALSVLVNMKWRVSTKDAQRKLKHFTTTKRGSATELFLNAFFFYHECKKKETQSVIVVAGVVVAGVVVLASLASLALPSKKRKRAY